MFEFSLSDVPAYCQYGPNYCGAASAQMIMNGYPDAGSRQLIDQDTIYNWMQTNQTEAVPYKAPGIVRDAIHHFNLPPSPARFVAPTFEDAEFAMYTILGWIRRTSYPAAAMINGNHWVVITGFKSDVDPVGNSEINLDEITINEPFPFCG